MVDPNVTSFWKSFILEVSSHDYGRGGGGDVEEGITPSTCVT